MMTDLELPASSKRRRRRISKAERQRFLEGLEQGFSIAAAARLTGHSRQRYYELRAEDEGFARAWLEALETGTDLIEDRLREIALNGVTEVTRNAAGEVVSTRVRDDPNSLWRIAIARRPEVWSEKRRLELSGSDGGPLEVTNPNLAEAVERFTAQIRQLGERQRAELGYAERCALEAGDQT